MAVPADLEARLDAIAYPFGGISEFRKIYTERELYDIALFNGQIGIVSAASWFRIDIDGNFVLDANDEPIEELALPINIGDQGYRPGSKYTILDHRYRYLYQQEGRTYTLPNETDVIVYGLNQLDVTFVRNSWHGRILYMYYENEFGPKTIMLLVNRFLHPQIQKAYIEAWKRRFDNVRRDNRFNEMFLSTQPALTGEEGRPIVLRFLAGIWSTGYTFQEIIDHPDSEPRSYIPGEIAYFRPTENGWLAVYKAAIVDSNGNITTPREPLVINNMQGFGVKQIRPATDGVYYVNTNAALGPATPVGYGSNFRHVVPIAVGNVPFIRVEGDIEVIVP